MRSLPAHPPVTIAMSAWLAVAWLGLGCAEQNNPVLPSSSGSPGGVSSTVRIDAAGKADTQGGGAAVDTVTEGDAQAADAGESDASYLPCDLLAQDCPRASDACYPVGYTGQGGCQLRGEVMEMSSCTVGEDQPVCGRGWACVPVEGASLNGMCYKMCDLREEVSSYCPAYYVCAQTRGLPLPANVGVCTGA
ncbi:MAG: hypothetical protein JXP73_14345 [Deltaproteobacteria bacterium]|nr:hypothetical protein [Deltaproteobacteria bacterium]